MAKRTGFTLVELLITISIIGIMAGMVVFAMFQSQEAAREQKTRALIAKLNNIIMQRYESYRTRRVPITFTNAELANTQLVLKMRIDCLRDLMRMEMPDRWSDVLDGPVAPLLRPPAGKIARPSASSAYLNRYNAVVGNTNWPPSADVIVNQGAECLYMIVMESLAQEGDSREVFKAGDVKDTDGDGFPEFVDAWGRPIELIRWAPGFLSPLQSPIRIRCSTTTIDPHTVEVKVVANDGPRLSQTTGSYVGGTIALIDQTTGIIDPRSTAKITGYNYKLSTTTPPGPPTVTFTCSTPALAVETPFNGNPPSGGFFVVMQPDPFDPRGIYPLWHKSGDPAPPAGTTQPTYAIYPLIISAGGDKAVGVKNGAGGGGTLRYSNENVNPFYVAPALPGRPFGMLLGSVPDVTDGEPLWKKGCDLDNITSHNLGSR